MKPHGVFPPATPLRIHGNMSTVQRCESGSRWQGSILQKSFENSCRPEDPGVFVSLISI